MQYSFAKGLTKTAVAAVLFLVPVALEAMPEQWMNMSVGAVLFLAWNYVKVRFLS